MKSNREDAYIVQCTAITPTQCTRILKITLHVHKAALIKNKTLYDEIKLLFQANFHLHHNCAKHTRKLGWHLICWSFGLPPCTANTQSLGFFFTMSTIDERRCSLAISFVNFTTAITKMNKNDNKVTTTIILVIYIFFFKNPEIQTWNIYHANSDFSWFVDNLFFNILVQYHYWHFTEIKSIGNRRTYSFIFYFTHKVIFWFYYKKNHAVIMERKLLLCLEKWLAFWFFAIFYRILKYFSGIYF